jgi:tripartite-type tricarboxylate transporter receptor subunit TctC
MIDKSKSYRIVCFIGLIFAATSAAAPAAESGAAFFKGKTVTYIVSTSPGGNYDAYGRLIAATMEKYLPGSHFVVKNVPGAGHIIGANQIYNAKPDGLTIGTFNTGLVYAQILKRKGIRFDLAKMSFLGKAASDPRVLILSSKAPYQSFSDLQKAGNPIKMAAAGVGSAAYNETKLLESVFGLKLEIITGYRGNAGEMAMLRGEVDGQLGSYSSLLDFVNNGYARIALQVGGKPSPGVPRAIDVASTDEARAIVNLINSQAELARLTAGPPGIPADRLQALRAAYQAALEDPKLLADAKKRHMPIDPAYGEEVQNQVEAALHQNPMTEAIIAKVMDTDDATQTVKSQIYKLEDRNKIVHLKDKDGKAVTTEISGSRTKLTVNGEPAKRKSLKVGMTCEVVYLGPGTEAKTMSCQ